MKLLNKTTAIAIAAGALAAACTTNTSGDLSATKTGDMSHPPAARSVPGKDLIAACGDGYSNAAGETDLVRRPYLQLVGDRTATVVWVSASGGPMDVELSRPDGNVISTVDAVPAGQAPNGSELEATLDGLEPDTVYCYVVRASGEPLADRAGFRTAPATGADATVRFVAFGDSGEGGLDQEAVLEQMETVPFDLLIHLGDIAYDNGTAAQLQERVFDVYADLMASFPLFPASGNHEYGTSDAQPFRDAFVLPDNGGPGGVERWYSFDWGDVHFVALDTEKVSETQAAWLDADLTKNQLPWTIVYFHKPPYSSGQHGSDLNVRKTFGPILEAHHVPLVLNGHDHDYERVTAQNGVNYVVAGGGGKGTRPVGTSDFTAFSEAVLNFVYVTVTPKELSLHAIDGSGEEFDQLVIPRP